MVDQLSVYFACLRSIYPGKFKYFFLVLSICADQTVLLSQLHCTGTHHPVSPEDNAQPKSHILVFIPSFKLFNSLLINNNCSHAKTTDAASFLNLCFPPGDPAAGRPWLLRLWFCCCFVLCCVVLFSSREQSNGSGYICPDNQATSNPPQLLLQLLLEQLLYIGFVTVFAFQGAAWPAKRA